MPVRIPPGSINARVSTRSFPLGSKGAFGLIPSPFYKYFRHLFKHFLLAITFIKNSGLVRPRKGCTSCGELSAGHKPRRDRHSRGMGVELWETNGRCRASRGDGWNKEEVIVQVSRLLSAWDEKLLLHDRQAGSIQHLTQCHFFWLLREKPANQLSLSLGISTDLKRWPFSSPRR